MRYQAEKNINVEKLQKKKYVIVVADGEKSMLDMRIIHEYSFFFCKSYTLDQAGIFST